MKYEVLTELRRIDRKKWSEFVYNHPNGNIFQTPEMFEVYESTKNYEPVFLAIVNEKDEILGTLLAVIQKEHSGILGEFSSRAIIFGGPLVRGNNPEVLDHLLKEYDKIIKKKAVYSQFRNFWDWGNLKDIMQKSSFVYEEHLNILVDLSKPQDLLWKDVHSKRRNEIRRSKKENTIFSVEKSEEALKECYSILKEVYSRAKLPMPEYNYFLNLLNMGSESGMLIFCAKYEDKIIGCMIALEYKEKIYDFYAGSKKEFYNKYPNDLIPWEVFLWAKENGYKTFDFGGAGKPNVPYGVRDYKKKFGGELVNFGRFEKIHKPILMITARIGFKFWQLLKNKK